MSSTGHPFTWGNGLKINKSSVSERERERERERETTAKV